ncbi:hypothetical protein PFISCL1PPCAC_16796, partial [Pristionchus fissidentatus]
MSLFTRNSVQNPVIYRYIDVIESNLALLEAIHFELFMPDRADLRFLAVPFSLVPAGTVEGDYFQIYEVSPLAYPSFAVQLEQKYAVVWAVAQSPHRMHFETRDAECGLVYVMNRRRKTPGVEWGVSLLSDHELLLRASTFDDPATRAADTIVRVIKRTTSTAHLYPVEPPLQAPPPSVDEKEKCSKVKRSRRK